MLVDAAAAVELEPPGSPWHPAAMAALGVAHAVTGAREQAAKELELAAELGRDRQRPAAVTALAETDLSREGGHLRVPSAMTLSSAEMRVLQRLPTHLSLGEIGDELHTSRNTVKTQVAAVYRKLQCSTRTEAVHRGRDLGLLEP
jgi:LuxR family maltose regulon positive regulatory protein